MANLKNVKINSNTVIDVEGNLFLTGQSSLKDKDGSNIINYNGYWTRPSIVHPGNSLDIDISSPQNSSLDIKNSDEGSASLKVNGVEIVNTNSIVNASTIEDKFLRNDQDDETTGALTAQKFITNPVTTEYQNSMILFRESEFRIESDLTEQTFLNIVNNQACAGLKVNNTEIVNPETSKVNANVIEDKFLRNDGNDTTSGSLTATKFISNIATGTEPYACTSTTLNANLNADLLDGNHASNFAPSSHNHDTAYLSKTADTSTSYKITADKFQGAYNSSDSTPGATENVYIAGMVLYFKDGLYTGQGV